MPGLENLPGWQGPLVLVLPLQTGGLASRQVLAARFVPEHQVPESGEIHTSCCVDESLGGEPSNAKPRNVGRMDTLLTEEFGSQFAFDEAQELDLMVDLLFRRNDYLNVCLAYASFTQRFPDGLKRSGPATRQLVTASLAKLLGH